MFKQFAIVLWCWLSLGPAIGLADVLAAAKRHAPPTPAKDQGQSEVVIRVHQLVNELRQEQGLAPLTLDPIISAEASEHSADMTRNPDTISHRGFNQRLQEIKDKIPYRAAAENVALNVGYDNPARTAVEGWKQSPEHRKNMLGDFTLTGIGIARGEDGGYFFTQIFIKPLK